MLVYAGHSSKLAEYSAMTCLFLLQCHNYPTPEDYYKDLNGLTWIAKIETPTLFVSAEDDPFLDVR